MKLENAYKIKLLKILEILRQETDEDHPMNTQTLIQKLAAQGIVCDRRTLPLDIQVLNDYGYEVLVNKQPGFSTEYCIVDRSFDVPELRILMDAVQAASFVTPKKTTMLLDKIAELGGSHRAELLKGNSIEYNTTKHSNETIYYNIDTIEEAIAQGKKIAFKYFDYNTKKEKVFRKEGKLYYVNPISMVFTMDNYYLICYDDFHPTINHYRIDRMTDVIMKQYDIKKTDAVEGFDMTIHHKSLFGMFTGKPEKVRFEANVRLVDAIIDKFGEDIQFKDLEEGWTSFEAVVQISPQFLGWLLSFGKDMKVTAPKNVVKYLREYVEKLKEIYLQEEN